MEDNEVIDFIDNFLGGQGERIDVLTYVYTHGYCYYFAHMLKTAFGRGHICFFLNTPHVVCQDEDKRVYDIQGELFGPFGNLLTEESAPYLTQYYKQLPKRSRSYELDGVQRLLAARLALAERRGRSETN